MTTLLTGGSTRARQSLDDDVDLARDRVLVTRAQNGDRTAFDDLYMRYYRRLYRFCLRRLHDQHEAEDVAQEAFARAWRALPSFAGDRRFYPWLSVIASHLCTDVLRRRNRSTPVAEFHQGNVASTEDGGEELMIAAVDSALVAQAFTRLSDRHQRILHLREGSGWSYQRIADHEGVGITAVETLLWRARQALKREFASLAGAEGRMAGILGGIFSVATLRKLLSLPNRTAKRMATSSAKGATIAAGSAVAATAMVIGATLSAPHDTTVLPHGEVPSISQQLSGIDGTISVPGAPAASGTTKATPGLDGLSLTTPTVPGNPLSGVPGANGVANGVANAFNQAGSSLTGVGNSVDSTLGNLTGTLGGAVQNLSGTVGSVLGGVLGSVGGGSLNSVSGLVNQPLSGVSSLLNGVSGVESGTTGSGTTGSGTGTSGTSNGTTSGTTGSGGLVGGTVQKLTNTIGGLLGG